MQGLVSVRLNIQGNDDINGSVFIIERKASRGADTGAFATTCGSTGSNGSYIGRHDKHLEDRRFSSPLLTRGNATTRAEAPLPIGKTAHPPPSIK
jgi:hypothetical protein